MKNINYTITMKYAFITNKKYYYNSAANKDAITSSNAIAKLSWKNIKDGNSSNLTFKTCCEYYKALDSSYECE